MSKHADLAKNTAILAFGRMFTQFISFFLLPLYTYFLTPVEYGSVDLIVTYLVLLAPILTLQLEMALFRFLVDARYDEELRKEIISNVVYLLFPLLVILATTLLLFINFFDIIYAPHVLFAGISLIFVNLLLQIARGLGDNKQFAIASIIIGCSTALTAVCFIGFLGMRIEGVLLSIAVSNLAGALYLIIQMKIYNYICLGLKNSVLQRRMLGYSTPLIPNGAAWWIINVSDRTIIILLIGVAANGIYAVSNKYASIFTSLFGIFSMSWTESASMHIDAKDRDKFFSEVSNAALRVFGSLGLGLIAAIPFVFSLFVNESFNEAYYYIPILVLSALFNAVVGLYSAIYVAKKLTRQVMNTSLVAAGINILLTIGLIPFFGLYAAASATALAFLAMAIFRHFDVKKYVAITYDKSLFVMLGVLYILIIALYYTDNFTANIIDLITAIIASLILNKKAIQVIKTKVLGYAKNRKGTVQ